MRVSFPKKKTQNKELCRIWAWSLILHGSMYLKCPCVVTSVGLYQGARCRHWWRFVLVSSSQDEISTVPLKCIKGYPFVAIRNISLPLFSCLVTRILCVFQVPFIVNTLWDALLDLDDLTASTNSIMTLLSSLLTYPQVRQCRSVSERDASKMLLLPNHLFYLFIFWMTAVLCENVKEHIYIQMLKADRLSHLLFVVC